MALFHCMVRHGKVRFTFGGFSTGYCGPSGDRSANPASVPGCSLQQALLSVLPPGNVAAHLWVSRAARAAVPNQSAASGHRASSRETSSRDQSLSRIFGSVETTAKCDWMGHAHCRTRLSQCYAAAFQWGHSHIGGSRAGSVNGTRSKHSLEEGGHRGGPSSRQRVRVLHPYFIVPEKDGGLRPILDLSQLNHSVMQLKFRMLSWSRSCLKPDSRTGCHERSRRRLLSILIASGLSIEVSETILQSRALSMRKRYALKLRLMVRRPPA